MFNITIQGQSVRAALTALQQRFASITPLLAEVGEDMVARTKARFNTSTAPDGNPWKPKKRPDGRKTLVGESGDLRRQIISQAAGNVLTLTASARYAAIHQFGGRIERKAYQKLVRHRTDGKGELLRSAIMGGRGLVFARRDDQSARARVFEVAAHSITIPARPFMPITAAGELYPAERSAVLAQVEAWVSEQTQARA